MTTAKTLPNFPSIDQRNRIAAKLLEHLSGDYTHNLHIDNGLGVRAAHISGYINMLALIDAVITFAHNEMEG